MAGTHQAEHRFVVLWTLAALALIFAGFTPSWFARPLLIEPPGQPLTPLVIAHGALFTGWIVFFAAQVYFAASGRMKAHIALARWVPAMIAVLVINGFAAALHGAARGDPDALIPPDVFLLLPICETLGFGILAFWAWRMRGTSHVHKRLMLFAIAAMIGTGSGRLLGGAIGTFAVPLPFILSVWIFDWWRYRRIERAVLGGGLIALAAYAIPLALGFTAGWRVIAGQMIDGWSAFLA